MDVTFICKECGHPERDSDVRLLMLKVRMLNHIEREHPEQVEQFREVVAESGSPAKVSAASHTQAR